MSGAPGSSLSSSSSSSPSSASSSVGPLLSQGRTSAQKRPPHHYPGSASSHYQHASAAQNNRHGMPVYYHPLHHPQQQLHNAYYQSGVAVGTREQHQILSPQQQTLPVYYPPPPPPQQQQQQQQQQVNIAQNEAIAAAAAAAAAYSHYMAVAAASASSSPNTTSLQQHIQTQTQTQAHAHDQVQVQVQTHTQAHTQQRHGGRFPDTTTPPRVQNKGHHHHNQPHYHHHDSPGHSPAVARTTGRSPRNGRARRRGEAGRGGGGGGSGGGGHGGVTAADHAASVAAAANVAAAAALSKQQAFQGVMSRAVDALAQVNHPPDLLHRWMAELDRETRGVLRDVLFVVDGLVDGLMHKLQDPMDRKRLWQRFCYGDRVLLDKVADARRLSWAMQESFVHGDPHNFKTSVEKLHGDVRRLNLLADTTIPIEPAEKKIMEDTVADSWNFMVRFAEKQLHAAHSRLANHNLTAPLTNSRAWYHTASSLASALLAEVEQVMKAFNASLNLVVTVDQLASKAAASSQQVTDTALQILTAAQQIATSLENGNPGSPTSLEGPEPPDEKDRNSTAHRNVQRVLRFNERRPTRIQSQSKVRRAPNSATAVKDSLSTADKPRRRHHRMKSSPDELLNLQLSSVADQGSPVIPESAEKPESEQTSSNPSSEKSLDTSLELPASAGPELVTSAISSVNTLLSEPDLRERSDSHYLVSSPGSRTPSSSRPPHSPAVVTAPGKLPYAPRRRTAARNSMPGNHGSLIVDAVSQTLAQSACSSTSGGKKVVTPAITNRPHFRSRSVEDIFRMPDGES